MVSDNFIINHSRKRNDVFFFRGENKAFRTRVRNLTRIFKHIQLGLSMCFISCVGPPVQRCFKLQRRGTMVKEMGDVNGLSGFKPKWLSCVLVTKMCYFCFQHSCTLIPTQHRKGKKIPHKPVDKEQQGLCFGNLCPLRAFLCIIRYSLTRHFNSCDKYVSASPMESVY